MSYSISLTGSNIAFEFPNGISLFRNLHFSFGQKTYGLIGPNGVGKTTLLKLLSKELRPTHGSISINGTVKVLPQILHSSDLKADQTTIEEILNIKGILRALNQVESGEATPEMMEIIGDQWDIKDRVQSIFQSFGIGYLTLECPVSQLSGGELVKVHLASVQLKSPHILILDEPTNNLDRDGRHALYEFIQCWNQCMIVVSHDRHLLSRVQNIAELSNQGLQFYGGNFDFYLKAREIETLSLEQQITTAEQEQKKEKADLVRSMERQQKRMAQGKKKAAQGGIPKIMAGGLKRKAQSTFARMKDTQESRLLQVQSAVSQLRRKVKEENKIQIDMPETFVHSKKEILVLKDFNFKFADSADFLFPNPIHFYLAGPKRVRISGANGAGKTTLVKLLIQSTLGFEDKALGQIHGTVQLKSHRVAHLDQNVDILGDGMATLLEQFSRMTPHLSESERRIRLGRFLFNQKTTLKKISDLSGGEKMRAALACSLFSEVPPEVLILDEPTNNLDIDSIERIESALSQFQGAILVISHDSEFLDHISASEELFIPHRHSSSLIR